MTLRFVFDYVSPYAYLAWTQLPALAARHGRALEPVPVLFAGMLDALGTRGPAEVPAKRAYLYRHTARLAHGLGVPFAPPPAHPFNPLEALRVTGAVEDAGLRARVVTRLFHAAWGGGGGLEGRVAALLAEEGLDAAALLAAATRPEGKARLRDATEAALAAGAFGVPTFLVDGELFFGVDSLAHLDAFLAGRDPLGAAARAAWDALPVGARRGAPR